MNAIQDTSRSAYYIDVIPTLNERHRAVMQMFLEGQTYTNTELANALDWPINTVTPRVFELRAKGYLIEVEKRPCNITRRVAIVWGLNYNLDVKEY